MPAGAHTPCYSHWTNLSGPCGPPLTPSPLTRTPVDPCHPTPRPLRLRHNGPLACSGCQSGRWSLATEAWAGDMHTQPRPGPFSHPHCGQLQAGQLSSQAWGGSCRAKDSILVPPSRDQGPGQEPAKLSRLSPRQLCPHSGAGQLPGWSPRPTGFLLRSGPPAHSLASSSPAAPVSLGPLDHAWPTLCLHSCWTLTKAPLTDTKLGLRGPPRAVLMDPELGLWGLPRAALTDPELGLWGLSGAPAPLQPRVSPNLGATALLPGLAVSPHCS